MTQETPIPMTESDRIERGKATRPWSLNEMTIQEINREVPGLHRRIDTVYVPWRVQEPVDNVEVLFTIDERVLDRRDTTLAEAATKVADIIADDSRLEEYVVWEHIEPSGIGVPIDDSRTRVKIEWSVGGEE